MGYWLNMLIYSFLSLTLPNLDLSLHTLALSLQKCAVLPLYFRPWIFLLLANIVVVNFFLLC